MMANSAETLQMYVWALSGVLGFLITLLIIVGKAIAKNIGEKLDGLLASVQELSHSTAIQTEQIKTLFSNFSETIHRLNDHGERIRDIEIHCGKCEYSKKL